VRTLVYTKDVKHPRIVVELSCDIDLLVACVKDGELKPEEVASTLNTAMKKVIEALHKGVAKKKAEAEE
jgi:fatty acid-binding protein DegV